MKIFYLIIISLLFTSKLFSQTMSIDIDASNPKKINLVSEISTEIYGIDLSGTIVLENTESFAKIILVDEFGKEYLIQEFFYPLYKPGEYEITGCEENDLIKGVIPSNIKIVSKNTEVFINDLKYCLNENDSLSLNTTPTENQIQSKINILNQNLTEDGFLWRAEANVYNKYYAQRKEYSDTINTHGYEYYSFGIFSPISDAEISNYKNSTKSTYVDEFDWRYRHGAMDPTSPYYDADGMDDVNGTAVANGWMTEIHSQVMYTAPTQCNQGCFLFGPINSVEARMNLYYNQHLNYNLSEQDAMDCNPYNPGDCIDGGSTDLVLRYIRDYGVVDEVCFPYVNAIQPCSTKCTNPTHKVTIDSYTQINYPTEDEIKDAIINNGPFDSDDIGGGSHAMCLTGYGIVEEETILDPNNAYGPQIIVDASSNYIGMTYWIQKNSRSAETGQNGYVYELGITDINFNTIWHIFPISGEIEDLINTNLEVRCVDFDGDGYYNWGIGPKPSTCPDCSLNDADGDDSDPSLGPMDTYGNLQTITPYVYANTIVNTNETWSGTVSVCGNLIVESNATLTITGTLIMGNHSTITVQNGGSLIVNAGTIKNANITIENSCNFTLLNNAIIEKDFNDEVEVNTGASFDFTNGSILELDY